MFAARKICSGRADNGVYAIGQLFDDVHALRRFKCLHDLTLTCISTGKTHIFKYRGVEQTAVLEYERYLFHQLICRNVPDVSTADLYAALSHVKIACNKFSGSRFAASRRPDKCDVFTAADTDADIVHSVFCSAVIAVAHVFKNDRIVFRMSAAHAFERLYLHNVINTAQCICNDHFLLARIGYLGQCYGQKRSYDDVVHNVEYIVGCYAALCEQICAEHQKYENSVYRRHKCGHRLAQHQRVSGRPFAETVNRLLEPAERVNRLPEHLYNRHASDVFSCLTAHRVERILIFSHFLLHIPAHHAHHECKPYKRRHKAQQSHFPVKQCEQHQQPHGSRSCSSLVRQIVCNERLRCSGRFVDCAAYLSRAVLIENTERQGEYPPHKAASHVGLNTKRRNMRAHQRRNVYRQRSHRKPDSLPRNPFYPGKILIPDSNADYPPQVVKRDKSDESADRRKYAPDSYQMPVPRGVLVQRFHDVGVVFSLHCFSSFPFPVASQQVNIFTIG